MFLLLIFLFCTGQIHNSTFVKKELSQVLGTDSQGNLQPSPKNQLLNFYMQVFFYSSLTNDFITTTGHHNERSQMHHTCTSFGTSLLYKLVKQNILGTFILTYQASKSSESDCVLRLSFLLKNAFLKQNKLHLFF